MPIAAAVLMGIAAAALAAPSGERVYHVDRGKSEVAFVVSHMIGKVRGHFASFGGDIKGDPARATTAEVTFTIKSASINTGLAQRDDHLRTADFFDVKTYPEIVFKSEKIVHREKNLYDVHGSLSMRGVTKRLVLPVYMAPAPTKSDPGAFRFETQTTLKRGDFGIAWNKAVGSGGMMLGETVDVEIQLVAVPVRIEGGSATAP
jgi:polyisoprenoid-binding protein YceI